MHPETAMVDSRQQELDTKNKVIASIFRISTLLTHEIDIDEILHSILLSARKDLGFSAACLFLTNEQEQLLACRMITGFGDQGEYWAFNKPFHLERHDCMETHVVRTGKVLYFEDSGNDPRATEIDRTITQRLNRGRVVYAPLTVKGKIIGCMGVNRPMVEPAISKEEIEAFTIFANHASIIIENSRFSTQLMTERNLKESILESSPNGILTIDTGGTIISINRAGEDLLSVHQDDILARTLENVMHASRIFAVFDEIRCSPSHSVSREFDFRREDGSRCCLEITPSPLRDAEGNETGTLFLIRDLTEKKIASEQVQRMGKLAAIGQLAAGISHEIRNPLMGIGATLELTLENLAPGHPQRDMLMRSMEEIERVDEIISDLLDLARPREMNVEKADINEIVSDATQFLAGICRKENITLTVDLDRNIGMVHMDRDKIRQVLINIALNAVQSMGTNGVLHIVTSPANQRYHRLDSEGVQITVEDTGNGIDPALKEKIFDPFFTTRPDGTGLGLYNCHKTVDAHGGSILIEDAVSGGTKVTVLLPTAVLERDE
jgi:two-component system NtrC family sensor kinase